jgi:hypothetical protein
LLNRKIDKAAASPKQPDPKQKYQPEALLKPLRRNWFASDQLCGKRLKVAIPTGYLITKTGMAPLVDSVCADLLKMSAATPDRLLKPLRVQHPKVCPATLPAWLVAENSDSDSHPSSGRNPVGLYQSQDRGVLRQFPGRRFRLEPDDD